MELDSTSDTLVILCSSLSNSCASADCFMFKAPCCLPCFSRTKSVLQITPHLLNRCFTHSLLLLIGSALPPRYTSWLHLQATCVGNVFPIMIMNYLILLCILSSSSFILVYTSWICLNETDKWEAAPANKLSGLKYVNVKRSEQLENRKWGILT